MQRNIVVDATQIVFLPVLEELDLSDNLLSPDCLPAVSEALRALPELRVLQLQASFHLTTAETQWPDST